MTNYTRTRMPLSSFDPRLRTLIERGCREAVSLPCESRRQAEHLRHTLTSFRHRLKEENLDSPVTWEPLYRTIISISQSDPCIVTLRPRGTDLDAVLSAAVGEAPSLEADPLAEFDLKE